MRRYSAVARAANSAVVVCSLTGPAGLFTGCSPAKDAPDDGANTPGSSLASALELRLVAEKKLSKLLPGDELNHFEASGIATSNGQLFVALDDATKLGIVETSLDAGKLGPGDVVNSQYEAVTATDDGRLFVMVESSSDTDTRAQVVELDASGAFVSQAYADVTFVHPNKGFEGTAWLRVANAEYLLGLCENNACKDDDTTPGEGRLKLLSFDGNAWSTRATIRLPEAVAFLDYSDLGIFQTAPDTYTVAIVSHKSAALWLGTLNARSLAFSGSGTFYGFPSNPDGELRYCSLEGVSFLGPRVLAFASDRSDGSANCDDESESVHLFQLP